MIHRLKLLGYLQAQFTGMVSYHEEQLLLYAKKEILLNLFRFMKYHSEFTMLIDITAADYEEFLEVVYHVMIEDPQLIQVKVRLAKELPVVPSIISVWKSANVMEREVFDLMGIVFEGHDHLKRILCPDDFKYHPLRKDFKLDVVDRFSEG